MSATSALIFPDSPHEFVKLVQIKTQYVSLFMCLSHPQYPSSFTIPIHKTKMVLDNGK